MNKSRKYGQTVEELQKKTRRMDPKPDGGHGGKSKMIMDRIALLLAIIGGLNWGSIGVFKFDVVAYACGGMYTAAARTIYTIVGLAALWCISLLFRERDAMEHA